MGTKLIVNGRVALMDRKSMRQTRQPTPHQLAQASLPTRSRYATNADGTKSRMEELIDTRPIPPEVEREQLIQHEDGLVYRIVRKLNVQDDGWGTANFWLARYGVIDFAEGKGYRFLREWVHRGWMEAAMERGSPTKRFRCLDERKIYDHMWALWKIKFSLGPGEKERIRHALLDLKPLFEPETVPPPEDPQIDDWRKRSAPRKLVGRWQTWKGRKGA